MLRCQLICKAETCPVEDGKKIMMKLADNLASKQLSTKPELQTRKIEFTQLHF